MGNSPSVAAAVRVDEHVVASATATTLSLSNIKHSTWSGAEYSANPKSGRARGSDVVIEVTGGSTGVTFFGCVPTGPSAANYCPHFAVLLDNDAFVVNGEHFKYAILHVLRIDASTRAKLDIYFGNERAAVIARVTALCHNAELRFAPRSPAPRSTLPLSVIAPHIKPLFEPAFLGYTTGALHMALDETAQVNCALAALRMEALLFGRNPQVAVDQFVADNRGLLLEWSRADLNALEGIPCTDVWAWDTIEVKTKPDGTKYCLQSHKENRIPIVGLERLGDYSIHRNAYRIIKRSPDDGRARLPLTAIASVHAAAVTASVIAPFLSPVFLSAAATATAAGVVGAERWFDIKRGDALDVLRDVFGRL